MNRQKYFIGDERQKGVGRLESIAAASLALDPPQRV
jgi:hypothetical protein